MDSGVGIAREFLPHVFDRFRQADSSATRPAGGLGLGLAIVQHIVSLHGGRVYADSPGEGHGATFSVHLPLEQRIAPVTGTAAPTVHTTLDAPVAKKNGLSLPRLPAGTSLMVVDDDPDTREMLTQLLTLQGANVWQAESGWQALQLVEQRACRPDAVISDIGMPGLDGIQLRRHMKDLLPQTPMVALTAYAAASDKARALEAGFDKYLAKPVDPLDVLLTIRELVRVSDDEITQ
jgi:CheY-like chemotaxis protein